MELESKECAPLGASMSGNTTGDPELGDCFSTGAEAADWLSEAHLGPTPVLRLSVSPCVAFTVLGDKRPAHACKIWRR